MGSKLTLKSDIYSFGIVLLEVRARRHPPSNNSDQRRFCIGPDESMVQHRAESASGYGQQQADTAACLSDAVAWLWSAVDHVMPDFTPIHA